MSTAYYIPSGKYPPYAPFIFCVTVFISSAITGIFYRWVTSDYGFYNYIDLFGLMLFCISLVIYINYLVITKMLIMLKIRNPDYFRQLAIMSTVSGWGLSFVALYFIASYFNEADTSFIDFYRDRLSRGITNAEPYLRYNLSMRWYPLKAAGLWLFITWVAEISLMSLLMGNIARCRAEMPFSESSQKWHKGLHLWPSIVKPDKNLVYNGLKEGDITFLLSCGPDKYQPKKVPLIGTQTPNGWARLSLLIPDDGDDYYISLSG